MNLFVLIWQFLVKVFASVGSLVDYIFQPHKIGAMRIFGVTIIEGFTIDLTNINTNLIIALITLSFVVLLNPFTK